MRIGLTYDLRRYVSDAATQGELHEWVEQDRETTDALVAALVSSDHEVVMIGDAKNLIDKLAAGERPDLIFNTCEGELGASSSSQIPSILESVGIAYTFSGPLTMATCAHKGTAKSILRDAGIATADFWVVETLEDLKRVDCTFPAFARPVSRSSSEETRSAQRVADVSQLAKICCQLLGEFAEPVLVETYLPGRELTVCLLGNGPRASVIGSLENDQVPIREDELVVQSERTALAAWRRMDGCDAGLVDLRADGDGLPHVLRVRPLPALHPQHSEMAIVCLATGVGYRSLVARIVELALQRATDRQGVDRRLTPRRPHMLTSSAIENAKQ